MDGDFDIGYQFVGRRNQESDVDRVEDVGTLVRLVREGERFAEFAVAEKWLAAEADTWLAEARALLKNED